MSLTTDSGRTSETDAKTHVSAAFNRSAQTRRQGAFLFGKIFRNFSSWAERSKRLRIIDSHGMEETNQGGENTLTHRAGSRIDFSWT